MLQNISKEGLDLKYYWPQRVGAAMERIKKIDPSQATLTPGRVLDLMEVRRLEALAGELEHRAAQSEANDPRKQLRRDLEALWRRYHGAASVIGEILPLARRDSLYRVLVPHDALDDAEAIESQVPNLREATELEGYIATFTPRVVAIEKRAKELAAFNTWRELSDEKKALKAVGMLAERLIEARVI